MFVPGAWEVPCEEVRESGEGLASGRGRLFFKSLEDNVFGLQANVTSQVLEIRYLRNIYEGDTALEREQGDRAGHLMGAGTELPQSLWLLSLVSTFPGWQVVKIEEGTHEKNGEPCAYDS